MREKEAREECMFFEIHNPFLKMKAKRVDKERFFFYCFSFRYCHCCKGMDEAEKERKKRPRKKGRRGRERRERRTSLFFDGVRGKEFCALQTPGVSK